MKPWSVPILLLFICWSVSGQKPLPWTYGKGRSEWCHTAKECCGQFQSPVDLSSHAEHVRVKPFRFHGYDRIPSALKFFNSGHTVNAYIEDKGLHVSLSGGGLTKRYLFDSFHFHWGSVDSQGSEHTVDGERVSLELHLVHYSSNYKSFEAAKQTTNDSDAIAVISVLFNVTEENEEKKVDEGPLELVARALSKVEFRDEESEVNSSEVFPLRTLLPRNTKTAFRYHGSLTTPPCTEGVVWTVFTQILPISHAQLLSFRDVRSSTANDVHQSHLEDNFRLEQTLNGRKVDVIVT